MGAAAGPEPITALREASLEDRPEPLQQGLLYEPGSTTSLVSDGEEDRKRNQQKGKRTRRREAMWNRTFLSRPLTEINLPCTVHFLLSGVQRTLIV